MVGVEDDHLGGATRFAAGLDHAGEGVEAAHEAKRTGGLSAAGERLHRLERIDERFVPVPDPHLKSMPSVLRKGQDGVERIVDRVDEAGRALRVA